MSLQKPYTISCPGCNNTVVYYSRLSHYVTCPGCNKFIQKNELEWKINNKYNKQVRKAIDPVFEVGKCMTVAGTEYTIIAIAAYLSSSTEWNSIGEKDTTPYWPFIEYTLMDKHGRITHVYSDSEYTAEVTVTAEPPVYCLPEEKNGKPGFFSRDKKVNIVETGNYDLGKFFGEFSCLPYKESVNYTKLRHAGKHYTVEWTHDDNWSVGFYSEKDISPYEFKKQMQKASAAKFYKLTLAENLFAFWGILILVFLILAAIAANVEKESAIRQTVGYDFDTEVNAVKSELFPFKMYDEGAIYELKINNVFNTGSDAEVLVSTDILDENHKIINSIEGEFSIESGYDDEGRWEEKNLEGRTLFVLDKAGTYYLRATILNTSKFNANADGVITILLQKTLLIRYYLIGALICTLLFFGSWQLKEHYQKLYLRKNGIWTNEYITNFWIGAAIVIILVIILV